MYAEGEQVQDSLKSPRVRSVGAADKKRGTDCKICTAIDKEKRNNQYSPSDPVLWNLWTFGIYSVTISLHSKGENKERILSGGLGIKIMEEKLDIDF